MGKVRRVGTEKIKKSEIIRSRKSFLKRWENEEDITPNFDQFRNRLINIIDGMRLDANAILDIQRQFFDTIGVPYFSPGKLALDLKLMEENNFHESQLQKYISKYKFDSEQKCVSFLYETEVILNILQDDCIAQRISECVAATGLWAVLCKNNGKFMFYPSGAELLDIKVVNDPLNWLENYPKAREKFNESLILHQKQASVRQVIDTMRLAFELFLKQYFGNTKSLENQKDLLGQMLKSRGVAKEIRDMCSALFAFYTNYNNEHAKHDDNCNEVESEYMIYLTGTFIRLLIQVKELEDKPND